MSQINNLGTMEQLEDSKYLVIVKCGKCKAEKCYNRNGYLELIPKSEKYGYICHLCEDI